MSLYLRYLRSTDLYRRLCGLYDSLDGNLLESTDDVLAESQVEFLRWAVHLSQPRVILETGTNKGFFLYLMSHLCRDATIYTIDIDPRCGRAVELINQSQRNVTAVFHAGDSREILRSLNVSADFAWVDGGHSADIPFIDLMYCHQVRVPYVAVDDTAYPAVRDSVDRITLQTQYRAIRNPFAREDRRQAVLLHLDSCQPKQVHSEE